MNYFDSIIQLSDKLFQTRIGPGLVGLRLYNLQDLFLGICLKHRHSDIMRR